MVGVRWTRGRLVWSNVVKSRVAFVACAFVACLIWLHWSAFGRTTEQEPDSFTTLLLFCSRNSSEEYSCEPLVRSVPIPVASTRPRNLKESMESSSVPVSQEVIDALSGSRESLKVSQKLLGMKYRTNGTRPTSLLTMFTTMKDIALREQIHANTLLNWAALSPWLVPILFASNSLTEERWSNAASGLGWTTVRTNYAIGEVPILKRMFKSVEERGYDTPFIGYANADVLFDDELIKTLLGVLESYDDVGERMILLTGRRKNINAHLLKDAACLSCLRNFAFKARLYQPDAEDYFIFSRAGFPWDNVPEFVVGAPGYDNWLVAKALQWDVAVIDGSRTINAIHQIGAEGVKSGRDFNRDPQANLRLVSSNFNYEMGWTSCATQKTIYSYRECPSPLRFCVKYFVFLMVILRVMLSTLILSDQTI
ncbi:hypothetical protein LSH36_496g01027 [Paralvinella palmiformis]|uniref:Uncharacterized protein n=1 Tax=Paralvinella palmiformis TaxID=53620 RepID=A0AAD9J985_9ANNE|nr:hypothetical protein LSH36_496g01027 [Paralvinella palmiformis]